MLRKNTIYILIFLMLLNVLNIAAIAEEKPTQQLNKENIEVQLMIDLGIMSSDSIKTAKLEETITRRQFAEYITKISNFKIGIPPVATKQIYSDIAITDQGAGEIQYLAERGYISGIGAFRPDDMIVLPEACKIILNMAGYQYKAESYGDYPANYLAVASSMGLVKKIQMDAKDVFNREQVAQLFYNAFQMNIMIENGINSDGTVILDKGKDLSEEVMELYKGKGVVTATAYQAMYVGNGAGVGKIEIDRVPYFISNDVSNELGCLVDYWYVHKESQDDDKIYSVTLNSNCEILKVDSTDKLSLSDRVYTYDDHEKTKTAEYSAGASIIYNGRSIDTTTDLYMVPSYGYIELIDHTSDGIYDVVKISSVKTITVSNINEREERIYGKDNECIDLSVRNDYTIFDKNDTKISFKDIKEWNIISYQESENNSESYTLLRVFDQKIEGTVDQIGDSINQSDFTISIDNKPFEVAKDVYAPLGYYLIGIKVTCYLDMFGRIASINPVENDVWRFGYVMNVDIKKGVDGACLIKLLDQDGKIYIKECDDTIILDGNKVNGTSFLTLSSATNIEGQTVIQQQLIRYKESNQHIKYIDTSEYLSVDSTNSTEGNVENCLLNRTNSNIATNKFADPTTKLIYKKSGSNFSGRIVIDANPIIFTVPSQPDPTVANSLTTYHNQNITDYDFMVSNISNFVIDQFYSIAGFNTSSKKASANVIVNYAPKDSDTTINADARAVIVDSIATVTNKRQENSLLLKGLSAGKSVAYVAKSASIFQGLKRGDVLRVATDAFGEVVKIETMLIDGAYVRTVGSATRTNPSDPTFEVARRYSYGNPVKKIGSNIVLKLDTTYEVYNISTFSNIYVYDKTGSGKVYNGTISDIPELSSLDTTIGVLVYTKSGENRDIVVIK